MVVYLLDVIFGVCDFSFIKNFLGKFLSVNIVLGFDGKLDIVLWFFGSFNSYIEFLNNGRLDIRCLIICIVWVYNEGRGGLVF